MFCNFHLQPPVKKSASKGTCKDNRTFPTCIASRRPHTAIQFDTLDDNSPKTPCLIAFIALD